MRNYYLIDFENVKSQGLETIKPNLKKNDRIYIFFSDKANTVNIETMTELQKMDVKIKFMKIKNGQKDALDWQLASYLGYIIHKYRKQEKAIHIVSKDHGFNILLPFWKKENIDIITIETKQGTPKKKAEKKTEKKPVKAASKKVEKKTAKKVEAPIENKVEEAIPVIPVEEVKVEPKKVATKNKNNKNYYLLAINDGDYKGVYKYLTHKERQDIEKKTGCDKDHKKYFNHKQEKAALAWAGVDNLTSLGQLTTN